MIVLLLLKFYKTVNPSYLIIIRLFIARLSNIFFQKMMDGWLQNPSNKNILRFYNSQSNSKKIFIVYIDEIVKKDQETDFIIKEKKKLKVNEAVDLWRNLKTKGWKEMKTKNH